jgi:hypothetical protein
MNDLIYSQRWPTPWERVQSLLGCLEHLQTQFKEAIARLLGGSVAKVVRDLVRFLLGNGPESARRENDGWSGEDEHEQEESLWNARRDYQPQDAPEGQGWLSSLVAFVLSCLVPITAWAGSLIA